MTGEDFRVQEGKKVTLDTWPTQVKRVYTSKKSYHDLLNAQVEESAFSIGLTSPKKTGNSVLPT